MAYDNLLFEVSEQIARITFNRPNVLNALNRKTMDELGDCLKKVRADDAVRVLILTGAGEKAFIAGADINELSQQTPVNGREFTLYGQEIIHRLETLGKPAIAAINGFALGAGCEAGNYSRVRRFAAAAALVRQRRGARIDSDGRNDHGGRGFAHRTSESRGGTGRIARDGGSDRQKNNREPACSRNVCAGSRGARDGNAAGRRLASGSHAFWFVLRDAGYARRHAGVSGKAAAEVRGALKNGGKIKAGQCAGWIERGGSAHWRGGEPVQ